MDISAESTQRLIAVRERADIVHRFGTLDWDPNYDHEADRRIRDQRRIDVPES